MSEIAGIKQHVHPHVQVFTPLEVMELNTGRHLDDQIELTESGLPRSHCSYVDCPLYLAPLPILAKDKALKRRGGEYGEMERETEGKKWIKRWFFVQK